MVDFTSSSQAVSKFLEIFALYQGLGFLKLAKILEVRVWTCAMFKGGQIAVVLPIIV
jgi:hypothetical protein